MTYKPKKVTPKFFVEEFQQCAIKAGWKSYIGYATTADYIARLLGVAIPLSRDETRCVAGDTLLVCKLKYRPDTATMKADKAKQAALADEDFELYIVIVLT